METKRILPLTLKKEWFDQIAVGTKTEEYRELKDFWITRLCTSAGVGNFKIFDEVHFRNGYAKDAPFMRVEFKGTEIRKDLHTRGKYFVIKLGKVLEINRKS